MRLHTIRIAAAIAVIALAACAAIQQQKKMAAQPDVAEFHNLRVLPQNITHDELIATMRGFAKALNVKCDHCHVMNPPGSKEQFDFTSDAKPEKSAARVMIRMTQAVNADYIAHLNPAPNQHVACMTCHRGHTVPDVNAGPPQAAPEPSSE